MSRFRRALAAATMAVAAAGGGLLIAAASAVPASASARPAAPGGHVVTLTARPRAHFGGIGPHVIVPCAVTPGATPADTCTGGDGPQFITCSITAGTPTVDTGDSSVIANLAVHCTSAVTSVRYTLNVLRNGVVATTRTNTVPDTDGFAAGSIIDCETVSTYQDIADALITWPPGYVLVAGSNPIHSESAILQVPPFGCSGPGGGVGDGGGGDGGGGGGGGGGDGGCGLHAPSLTGHPAGRHPDFVSCG